MHETIIANNILEEIEKKSKWKKIKSVTLEVGELAHLTGDELKNILKTMIDFEVIITPVKAEVKCKCGYVGKPKILARAHEWTWFECPKCGAAPAVTKGEDIIIREIKTE